MIWNILSWIVCGFLVGLIARAILPGRQSMGFVMTTVLGIVGAFVGGLISSAIWPLPSDPTTANVETMWPGWIFSILGGVIVLWAYMALVGRREAPLTRT